MVARSAIDMHVRIVAGVAEVRFRQCFVSRGGSGSGFPIVFELRIFPSVPWMRTSPPPELRARSRAASYASLWRS